MVRGPRKHLKRLAAPKSWLLDLKKGVFAPRPSTGPHHFSECIPLSLLLTDKLGYSRNNKETCHILKEKMVLINGRVRKDPRFPVGLFDVLSIPKANEHYRILYNVAGRFILYPISEEQAKFKLTTVRKTIIGKKNIPMVYTVDGGSFMFCDQDIIAGDTVKVDLKTGRIIEHVHLEVGHPALIKKGKNMGCVGTITHIEKKGQNEFVVKLKDLKDRVFATRRCNLVMIGKDGKTWIDLPEEKGVKLNVLEQSNLKYEGTIVSAEEQ
ncbi:40S ribosomal protein S4 [Pseudoloma neurophilia]|uniref:40S ribosomal protein S4 n=1 Tax=Pseudoloma neurophilia TaxID=146866 RepID=A0A0R0LYQ4_9MICR|nr:40S ribosomal protein S4 [Pseudoloma neurophilia]